ncbi:hypothetical protein [Halorhodospira halophila]|uniref:Phage baseplate assembly protein V n=1 Tax=Halorhodospira halophila (strain DSM 244 / SL1) TaxID=349124 RepID=A1WVJ5_HALHL|nr:hypothetical protein [Halorhodospira halophila]ABM61707.1 hypothetical protein Hhal_0931 [Halorhodospira halophila SL1]MBK1728963.1 hypothetical protein [Halorhodospira halophila]
MEDDPVLGPVPVGLYAATAVCWAEVLTTSRQGRATRVAVDTPEGITEWPVAGHARELSALKPGDRVVALLDPADQGLYLIHALADADEPPRAGLERRPDGSYLLRAEHGSIRLEVAGAELELGADGAIRIDGEVVEARARGEHRIRGARVAIN